MLFFLRVIVFGSLIDLLMLVEARGIILKTFEVCSVFGLLS